MFYQWDGEAMKGAKDLQEVIDQEMSQNTTL